MDYKQLFLLIEGDDDERFFNEVINVKLGGKYDSIIPWKYADKKPVQIARFLRSISSMGADYLYVADINDNPCVTMKKQKVKEKLPDIENNKVVIVIREIESWYLAGLDKTKTGHFRIHFHPTTDDVSKEQFNALIPNRFDSRVDFMVEILNHFSIETAKRRNKSFAYFINKHAGQI